jgi:hypothetical protein
MKRTLIVFLCAAGLVITVGHIIGASVETSSLSAQQEPAQKASTPDAGAQTQQATGPPTYADVIEIISKYDCTVCHGGADPRVGLSLDDHKSMMKGSMRGPVIVSGDPANSEIIRRLKGISEPRMPFTGPPWLSGVEVETVERWIAAGAPGPK